MELADGDIAHAGITIAILTRLIPAPDECLHEQVRATVIVCNRLREGDSYFVLPSLCRANAICVKLGKLHGVDDALGCREIVLFTRGLGQLEHDGKPETVGNADRVSELDMGRVCRHGDGRCKIEKIAVSLHGWGRHDKFGKHCNV